MWFLGRKLLVYLSDDKISLEKRLEVFDKKRSQVIKEFEKLTELEIINYLFKSTLPVEVKELISQEVDKIAVKDANGVRFKNIKNAFLRRYAKCEDVLNLDYCPTCFKKIVIDNVYGTDIIKVLGNKSVSLDKKKAIIDAKLSCRSAINLLNDDLDEELINFIIDTKIISEEMIKECLSNRYLSEKIKEKIVARSVTMNNFFSLTRYCLQKDREFIFKVKEKELEDYIVDLVPSNVLEAINSFPRDFTKKIIELNRDDIREAIKLADKQLIESCLYHERDQEIVNLIIEMRKSTILEILRDLSVNKLLGFLKSKFLPDEYKRFIIENRGEDLDKKIKSLSVSQVGFHYLNDTSLLPEEIKEKIYDVHKDGFIKKIKDLPSESVFNEIRYGSYDLLLKRLLIDLRINEDNIFKLLEIADDVIGDIVFELKGNLIKDYIAGLELDKCLSLEGSIVPLKFREKVLDFSKDILIEKISKLEKSELYKYIGDSNVSFPVKKVILEIFGIYEVDLQSCLEILDPENIKLLVDNYQEIKKFIGEVGIDFQSFIQYGSGSKKHSGWLKYAVDIISNDKEDFIRCKNYFFNNYYSEYRSKENAVYMISNFLEFLENYNKYRELCINLTDDNTVLNKNDEHNIKFLFNIGNVEGIEVPKNLEELSEFKVKLYNQYLEKIRNEELDISDAKKIFNDLIFCNSDVILKNIGGSGALRALKKDNIKCCGLVSLIDELMIYSQMIEMVNDSNNLLGLKKLLDYIFGDIETITKMQNIFSDFYKNVVKLYEMDSKNNLTHLSRAREIDGVLDFQLSEKYGGEVFDFSDKNYTLYAHVVSKRDNIDDMMNGRSSGSSNFISVSPISYRGQKYYWDIGELILAYDRIPNGSFICSSIYNLGSNHVVNNNSSEVGEISRSQRGILETSAVTKNNSEALLYREGLKPCGLILPGGRNPTKAELEYHKKYGLPFIITQEIAEAVNSPRMVFETGLGEEDVSSDVAGLDEIMEIFKENATIDKEDDIYTGREVALLTDCHSMYEPTLAALEDIRRHGITEIYSLGDNVGLGPNPCETFDLLEDYGVISVAGNSEYYNTLGIEPFDYFYDKKIASQRWTEEKLGKDRISKIKLYPASIDLMMGDKKLALCHFANDVRWDYGKRSTHVYRANYKREGASEQFAYTNSDECWQEVVAHAISQKDNKRMGGYVSYLDNPLFDGKKVTDYDAIIQGHVHFDMKDKLGDTDIYTLRAVGMGYEDKDVEAACYYVLRERKDGGVEVERRFIPFNKNNLIANIYISELPDKDKLIQYVKTDDYSSIFF